MVALPIGLRDDLVAHAITGAPQEVCGLIGGRGGIATRVIRCRNVHPTPVVRYAMDPREQWAAFRDLEANGEELIAIYHSHPITQPYPSPTDRGEAHYPDALYILVSLRTAEPEVRAYRLNGDWVTEVELQITGA